MNVNINKQDNINDCIICMDSGNLIKNVNCACNYYYHIDCYRKYGQSKCLLCKKEINTFMYILNPLSTRTINIVITETILDQEQQNQRSEEQQEKSICNIILSLSCVALIIIIIVTLCIMVNT
jgi:hypothetical protein